ncbi:Holliday junction resolvase RuvX [Beijerinckia mobilis]|uniref:Holliday junction resolvase RuvX n=1 Tax=Beijerinckia mobilis TaxID=231434 RepID=UPI00054E3201|nr:Holliday junction resolvase RuvX [Beijerinckia mobilis]
MGAKVLSLAELKPLLASRQRLIGIDLGTKTIGLSLSDLERRIATPLETIRRTKFTKDAERLMALADEFEIAAFVIGLPLNMDGTAGPRVQATEAFVRNCAALTNRPFCYWDERLSTAAVTRDLIAQDASRAKRAAVVDKLAAAFILQGALDRLAWSDERLGNFDQQDFTR